MFTKDFLIFKDLVVRIRNGYKPVPGDIRRVNRITMDISGPAAIPKTTSIAYVVTSNLIDKAFKQAKE